MRVPYRQLDTKSRRLFVLANLSMALGLLLWNFHSSIHIHGPWLDAVCGLLMGFSISVNLLLLYRRRRCTWPETLTESATPTETAPAPRP